MALQLRVLIVSTGQTKAMRFNQNMSISEMLQEIREKTNEGGRDHGIMQPADPTSKRPARWLKPQKTLQFYNLYTNDIVELRKKHRPIKVKLIDETVKTILVDDSLSVEEVVKVIGEKMDLRNPEEFSLAVERSVERKNKKGKDGKEKAAKIVTSWLNPRLSLHEQGVADEEVVSLKKKFYVDDDKVDRNDQVQLHLVYVQCSTGVANGDHPISPMEAAQFGALQCQILYGNYDPAKHTQKAVEGRIDQILPLQFRKTNKNLFNDMVREWRGLVNMKEIDAKYRYVQLCRSLKTYGITYYDVKYKPKGAVKLKPLKLGFTFHTIMMVDTETRAVLREHPITHLKRWASGPNSFTLDFGDYADSYFTVQTLEGESISQLVAGYIDILLKRRKDGGVIVEDDEGETAEEEFVAPETGIAGRALTTQEYDSGAGDNTATTMLPAGGMIPGVSPAIAGQVGKAMTLNDADDAILRLMGDVMNPIPIGQHGTMTPEQLRQDLAMKNQQLWSSAGMLIEASNNGASRQDLDKMAPDLAKNLANLIGAAKLAAAAAKGDVSLLDGAKSVSDALRKLMAAAGELADNPNSAEARMKLAQAAALLQASTAALNAQCVGNKADDPSRDLLLETAKAVAAATKDFLDTSDGAVAHADPNTKEKHRAGAFRVEMKNAGVADVCQAVAPVIADPHCKKYVAGSAKALTEACNALLGGVGDGVKDPKQRNELAKTAKAVNEAIQQLVNSTACVGTAAEADREKMAAAAFEIQDAVAKLLSAEKGDQKAIVSASKAIQNASRTLIDAAKGVAKAAEPNEKNRLLNCMTDLTNAVRGMLQTASAAASGDGGDEEVARRLRDEATAVGEAARKILGDMTTKQAAMAALRSASKAAAASASALVAESKGVARKADPETKADLSKAAEEAAHAVADLVKSVKDSWNAPENPQAEKALLDSVQMTSKPAAGLASSARAAVPKVADMKDKTSLNSAATNLTTALNRMMAALKAAKEADGHMEVDEALQAYAACAADMDFAIASSENGQFEPIPGQTRDGALGLLSASTKALRAASEEVAKAAKVSPQAVGPPAKKVTVELGNVMRASKAVASTIDTPPARTKVLKAAKGVADEAERVLHANRALSTDPKDATLAAGSNRAKEGLDSAIDYLLNAANSAGAGSEECDQAAEAINKAALESLTGFPTTQRGDLQEYAEELAQALKALDSAIVQVADAARNNPRQLGPAANLTASTMPPIMTSANNASAKTTDRVAGAAILSAGKQLADDTSYLLAQAKVAGSKPGDYAADQAMTAAMQEVRHDMAELLKAVDSAIPGKRDLLASRDMIEASLGRLTKPSVVSENPQINLREISEAARRLADAVGRIVASARHFPEKLGPYSKEAANAVSDIIDASKDAASHDNAAGVHLAATRVNQDGDKTAARLADVPGMLDATKAVAIDASYLIAHVKKAAQKETDAAKRRELITATDKATQAATSLAEAAKAVGNRQPGAEAQLQNAAKALESTIRAVLRANPRSKSGQDFIPLLDAARKVAEETSKLVDILRVVSGKPKDATAQTQLVVHAQATGEAIRGLVEAAENLTYGHKECKEAVDVIQRAIGDLDATAISATVPGLLKAPTSKAGATNQQCKEELIALSRDLAGVTSKLVNASKNNPEELGASAKASSELVPQIVESAIALTAATADSQAQQDQLKLVKNAVDSLLVLVQASRMASGNPHDKEVMLKLADAAKNVSGGITELVSSLRGGVLGLRACDEAMKSIDGLVNELNSASSAGGKSYAQCTDELTMNAKGLVDKMSQMVAAAKNAQSQPEKVGETCLAVAKLMPVLVAVSRASAGAATDEKVSQKLLAAAKTVVITSRDCVGSTKNVAADPKNQASSVALSESQRNVTTALAGLLGALREGATLERDAEMAIAKIQATTSDLDSAALFAAATAGQMEVTVQKGTSLDNVQQSLSKSSQKLQQTATGLGAASSSISQEELGKRFKIYAAEIEQISHQTKIVASLLGDLNAQQDVLTAAKALTLSSQSLILSSRESASRPGDKPSQEQLAKVSQSVSKSIQDLISVSENASKEAVKGIKEIEKSQSRIQELIQFFESQSNNGNGTTNPREVLPCLRNLGTSTGQIVSSATSNKESLCKAAQDTTRYMEEMLNSVKGLEKVLGDKPNVKAELHTAGTKTAQTTLKLLEAAKTAKETPESQKELSQLSEAVADRIMEVVKALRQVPGGEGITGLHDSGPDFDAIAEQELRKAAKMIEDAANRLLASRPRPSNAGEYLTEEDINSAILEAARAITVATASLVKAATLAQRDRIAKQRDPKTKAFYRADPTWANGLISAAQAVGATTIDLVESSNGFVQRTQGTDDAILISSARQVAAATARLMAASRAKSDPFSDTHTTLGNASKEVANATQLLVEAARRAAEWVNQPQDVPMIDENADLSDVARRKAAIEAQARLLRLQAEMDKAQKAVTSLNENQYKGAGGGPAAAGGPPASSNNSNQSRPLPGTGGPPRGPGGPQQGGRGGPVSPAQGRPGGPGGPGAPQQGGRGVGRPQPGR